jgi:protocatechuate 3,4-dioxygenase beta subunit
MNRKDFLRTTGAVMLAFTLPVKNNYAFGTDMETTDTCIPTTSDILGPYYRANAPFRSDLTLAGDPGALLNYKGKITDEGCNPLSAALVDVWQADSDGDYDNTSADFRYRGRFQTGADGTYAFRAVKPGWYLNGGQYRPAHLHFRVTRTGYTELITQLYFEGDPYIANDPWASEPEAEKRIVPINVAGGEGTAVFDITLKGMPTGIRDLQNDSPVRLVPNPVKDQLNLEGSVLIKNIEVFNPAGILVVHAYGLKVRQYRLPVNYLGNGLYFCRIETEKGIFVHKFIKE